jgi:hypothetical protein
MKTNFLKKGIANMCKKCEHHQDQDCDCDCEGKCTGTNCECGEVCGCESGSHFPRRYQTKEEQIAELENYLKDLKLEVQAVEERLTDLRK